MLRYVHITDLSMSPQAHLQQHMRMFLDLNHHPFHQPFKNGRIYKRSRNLDLTRVNATRLGLPVSILFECAGFQDSYRGITNPMGIEFVAFVGMQLLFDNSDCLNGVSS